MSESVRLHYLVDGSDFLSAGEASSDVKKILKKMGFEHEIIRKAAIAMYEGEINMVIHANGGEADVEISPERIEIVLRDSGPGIPDVRLAMTEGFSTAPDRVRTLGFGAGMGLPNMKKYTDEMSIDSLPGMGTTVRMAINVNSSGNG